MALQVKTLADVMREGEARERALARKMLAGTAHWGRWHYVPDADTGVLAYRDDDGRALYEVDLARCDSGSELLDWILELEGRSWITAADLGHFVRAVAAILPVDEWPQAPRKKQPVPAHIAALVQKAR